MGCLALVPHEQACPAMYVVMTVDTEEEWDWNAGCPTTQPRVTNIRTLPSFQALCERYGIAVTYFVNQAVLDDAESAAIIRQLAAAPGVEIGMHIHPWNTPPFEPGRAVAPRESFLANLPACMIRQKLESVWSSFQGHGLAPRSFRAGRYSSGSVVQQFLREKRFVADSSVVPFTYWDEDGAPDFRDRDLAPRRLPPRDQREMPLWELPLSLGFTRRPFALWRRFYDLVEHSVLSRLRLIGIAERLGLVRRVWLNFESPLGAHMPDLLRVLARMNSPYACLTVHSSSLLPGGNPWSATRADTDRLHRRLEEVFSYISRLADCEPKTIGQIADQLEARFHACHRN